MLDLVLLGIVWEFLGKIHFRLKLWLRAFLTLICIMWLDILLFSTGAFLGTPLYLSIIKGAAIGRLFISVFAFPLLYFYISWQNKLPGIAIQNRPVLAIIKEVSEVREQLSSAIQEINRCKVVEMENEKLIKDLTVAHNKVHKLEDLIPLCASCRRVRIRSTDGNEEDQWISMEKYIRKEISTELSHGICPECAKVMYPDLPEESD